MAHLTGSNEENYRLIQDAAGVETQICRCLRTASSLVSTASLIACSKAWMIGNYQKLNRVFAMAITTFESWRAVASLDRIQLLAIKVQECMVTCNSVDRQRGLLKLLDELRVPFKTDDLLGDLAEMFWNAMPKFVEFELVESSLKNSKSADMNLNPALFTCFPFGSDGQIHVGSDRVVHLSSVISDGVLKPIVKNLENGHGMSMHASSVFLGAGRYEVVHWTSTKHGEQSRTIFIDSTKDLESLELESEWSLRPLDQTFVLLKKDEFKACAEAPLVNRKSSSLYTSGSSKHIDAFEVLSCRVPVVSWTTAIVNAALLQACQKRSGKIFFLDIGMSFGRNCIEFLKALAVSRSEVEVVVFGIDPDAASLKIATAAINQFMTSNSNVKVTLTTLPNFLEHISTEDLECIFESARESEVRLVQSAFTLHHLSRENRQLALNNVIQGCKPHAFVLSEPNANHLEENYHVRVSNALGMFSMLHELIFADPKLSPDERFAVWNTFFGREIVDIVGTSEDARSEKHEPITNWIQRGQVAGLKLSEEALAPHHFVAGTFEHAICDANFLPGLTEIRVHGTPIVGVMVFVADN